ncbi:hypothetical protein ABW19_dt0202474 [Dactylella cylindrospora]|nr:hypothetical protein ABW19_dt0202474 [Dactylella cylindrospora]
MNGQPQPSTLVASPPQPKYKYRSRPDKLTGTWHVFSSHTKLRWWKSVHHYRVPNYVYVARELKDINKKNESQLKYRHRDFAGRITRKKLSDRYLHHHNGELRKLIVACSDAVYSNRRAGGATWRRTYVRNQAIYRVRIATWVVDYTRNPGSWSSWFGSQLRLIPACIGMTFCFWSFSTSFRTEFQGWYAPVAYQYRGDAKLWSNHLEDRKGIPEPRNDQEYRVLKPRYLCFLIEPEDRNRRGIVVKSVEEWEFTDGRNTNLSYIFIAYTQDQFPHTEIGEPDVNELHAIAETAARQAGVIAFWVAASCLRNPQELESDVYRISDVMRGSQGMAIVVGQPRGFSTILTTDQLLKNWGERMWTFPEVLLSPGTEIPVYRRGGDLRQPLRLSKNQFAGRVWEDADDSRQLIDSYLGNLGLTRLELSVLALRCLYRRSTELYLPGDHSYALMGLQRLRPLVNKQDSPFQAFARISNPNDSNMLLERYFCVLPLSLDQPWYDMSDAYQSNLWDITPYCQIAGICENDTVILDGAYGASIRWKSFYPIAYTTGFSFRRLMAILIVYYNGFILIAGGLLTYFFSITAGGPLLGLAGIIWLMSPRLVRSAYQGKITNIQAALFGVEGFISPETAERSIFGGSFGRMGWSVNGSPLSQYEMVDGERVAKDPRDVKEIRDKIERAVHARPGELRIFTLIDTYNMQLTLFEAVNPPICLLLCASEGGMQRAIGCSYDWTTQTMYRETVLRMPTTSLNRMDRVPQVRIGIKRPNWVCRERYARQTDV